LIVEYYSRKYGAGHSNIDTLEYWYYQVPELPLPRLGEYVQFSSQDRERKVIHIVHLVDRGVVQIFVV
jgi:hypothetical protein